MKIKLFAILTLSVLTMAAYVKHAPVVSFPEPLFAELKAGEQTETILTTVVAKGFHVQANPASQSYLIPTKLGLQPSEGLTPGKPSYPKGKPYRLKGASDVLSVYEEAFQIKIPLKAEASIKPGEYVLQGKLIYQACDERSCLPPTSVPVELHVKIN
jgi:DsbC/DsbD-like thiol-disulfide interchange protein